MERLGVHTGDVCERRHCNIEIIDALEDDGICLKVEEDHTPGQGDVNGREQDDGLKQEHGQRPGHGLSEGEGRVGLQLLGRQVPVTSSLFPELGRLLLEQNRSKSFCQGNFMSDQDITQDTSIFQHTSQKGNGNPGYSAENQVNAE